MEPIQNESIVPENITGKAVDLEEKVTAQTEEDAINTFNRACSRLLNPPIWHEVAGALSAAFELQTPEAETAERLAEVGDYLKIDVPGPGPSAGDGFDWVNVEAIEENTIPGAAASFAIRLRACPDPEHREKGTAHFFKDTATSTFVVKRTGNTVVVSYHGRNEVPNPEGNILDKVRNTVVALGAEVGLSELHWKSLVKGLLSKEIGGKVA